MVSLIDFKRVLEKVTAAGRLVHRYHQDLEEHRSKDQNHDANAPAKLRKSALRLNESASEFIDSLDEVREFVEAQQKRIEELENELDHVHRLVMVDQMTGALNRQAFSKHLDAAIAQSKRKQAPLALMMIDLDHLEDINQKYSVPAGDELLIGFVHLIKRSIRPYDLLFRIGGDRFALMFPNEGLDRAQSFAERLRLAVEHKTFRHEGTGFRTSFSAGLTELRDDDNWESLVKRLEGLVRNAKQDGRARICADQVA